MLRPVLSSLFAIIVIVARCCPEAIAGDVLMDGNGYLGVVVAFEPDIAAENRVRTVLATRNLMKETSKNLNRAIGKYMKGVTFLFPRSWDLTRMFPDEVRDPNAFETASSADFQVTAHGSVFGAGPHALQHNGCGQKGYKIIVPTQFMLDNDDASRDNAKIMAVEWMKYRYGVFNEGGFPDDPMYPLFYSVPGDADKNIHVTDCADVPVAYKNQNEDGSSCEPEVDIGTGRPAAGTQCRMLPDPEANSGVTSSLLSPHNSLSSVQFVCGDVTHAHNVRSPNKQNILCGSKSIIEVLKQHSDFRQMNNEELDDTNLANEPVFHYVQERPPRVVLAIDSSNKMEPFQDILYNAAADLIYSLPPGSEFSYVMFQQSAQVIRVLENSNDDLLSIPHDTDERNKLVLKMRPDRLNESANACVKCALLKAIQILAPSNSPNPGDIILMTANDPADVGNELLMAMKNSQLCLTAITFPGASVDGFGEILDGTDSCSKAIPVSEGATLGTMKLLFEAINNVANKGSFVGQRNVMLKLAEVDVENPITFVVDHSYENFTVWVSRHNTVDIFRIGGSIDLTSDVSYQQEKITTAFNFYVLQILNAQPSKWTFSLRPSKDFDSVLLKVMAFERRTDIIDVNAWVEDTTKDEKDNLIQMPIILYASILRDNNPIINANVTALVTLPDGRERISLRLLDDGLGDPDITQNDGIYSIYFINFLQVGEYEINVHVDDNSKNAQIIKPNGIIYCCGSKGPNGFKSNIEPFFRNIMLSFSSISVAPSDGYPPSTINDLRVSAIRGTFKFTLQWSAPGGEKNDGKVSRYILKAFESREEALRSESNRVTAIETQNVLPAQYGMTQSMDVTINSKKYNTSYYLVLKATNSKNKFSVSNIVEIYISPMTDVIIGKTTTPSTNDIKEGSLGKTLTTVIIVCSVAILLIIIICAVFCVYVRNRESKNSKPSNTDTPIVKVAQQNKTENKPLNNRNDGSIVASDWHLEREPISPISSVPAVVLMQHHEQVQDAKRNNRDPPLFTLENFQEPTEPKVTIDGVIALASSPKLQKYTPPNTSNLLNNTAAGNANNVQQKNYLEFKRQITSV